MNGYNLDSHKTIKVYNLLWSDNFNSLFLTKQNLTVEECLKTVELIITALDSKTNKGFLSSCDLTLFPVISEILPAFLQPVEDSELNTYKKGEKSMESYKWIYNIIILNLYSLCLKTRTRVVEIDQDDVFYDLKSKESELYSLLDQSIVSHLQKRGIRIKENIYIGFDTEFTSKDLITNTLVSAQLAVTSKTYIQLPKNNPYSISKVDEKTNKIKKQTNNSSIFNYKKIENSIQLCINEIRKIKYETYDSSMLVLTESLRMIKGLNYYEHEANIVFSLPRSLIQSYIHFGTSFSLSELILRASSIAKPQLAKINKVLLDLLGDICSNNFNLEGGRETLSDLILAKYRDYNAIEVIRSGKEYEVIFPQEPTVIVDMDEKRLSRKFRTDLFPQKVSVTTSKSYTIIAHLTPADLSMLSDFESIKEELSIVNGSFVTLGKPLQFEGRNIHIRDTMLLAPGGNKSLASIGKLYGGLTKIEISQTDLEDMQGFLERDKEKFIEYAMRDALISLIHASWMEEFHFKNGGIGIPLSLSSLGRSYVKAMWKDESYEGYQISSSTLLGDVSNAMTPKGLNVIKNIGFVLPYYIANYKGGRNECFMFGLDREKRWYDYDLTSAYTTVMSMAGHPDYENCKRLTIAALESMSNEEILFSYLIINADFEFPKGTKYPSIPCYVDENCTVYPLRGSSILTGAEYLLARSQNCVMNISDIYLTPFKTVEYKDRKPFASIVKIVQEQRREHLKGTISNMIYKEIGNGIYGSVVRGIGNKRKFDIKSKGVIRMVGDELTNPLIASWTTAFIRSIIGECLHSIQELNGLVVSVTTDGFITNVKDLESKISDKYLFTEFKKIRMGLSENGEGLEVKSSGRGIIAWTTRGQLGIESNIIATTGFQHRAYTNKNELLIGFLELMKTEGKTVEFVQSRLRSASDIYNKGGHLTMVHRDQQFRMHYDNRRVLQWESTIPYSVECLVDSKPLLDVLEGKNLRFIARMSKTKQYSKYNSEGKSIALYNNNEEIAIRNFLKGLLITPAMFNLNRRELNSYTSIVEYIKNYNPLFKINEVTLAQVKRRVNAKQIKWMRVQETKASAAFVKYVQQKFKDFDVVSYYK